MQKRQTAYKVWIADLVNNKFVKQTGEWEPNFLEVNGEKISRVNLIANVITKFQNEDKTFTSITLDDGSSTIRVKTWREDTDKLSEVNIGDILLLIGRLREYNDEIYLTPEIVKKLDNPNWELVRKLELIKLYGKPKQKESVEQPKIEQSEVVEEQVIETSSESNRQLLLNLIEKFDTEKGADITKVIENSKLDEDEADSLIQELLKEGEIFQLDSTHLKLID